MSWRGANVTSPWSFWGERWDATAGKDPLFAAVDGMNCPRLPPGDPRSHSLLLERGLIRVALPWPPRNSDGTRTEPEFTIEVVRDQFVISGGHIRQGLEEVIGRTGLKGRWQTIYNSPTVVCDTGHNAGGIQEVMNQIAAQKFDKLFMVWGMVKDKDVADILRLLPQDARYYFCQAKIPRAMDPFELCAHARKFGLIGEAVPDVNAAKRRALADAASNDFIFIGGSTFVVAEIEEL